MADFFPTCNRAVCFACVEGKCQVLAIGYKDPVKCPFFKTDKQVTEEGGVHYKDPNGLSQGAQ